MNFLNDLCSHYDSEIIEETIDSLKNNYIITYIEIKSKIYYRLTIILLYA